MFYTSNYNCTTKGYNSEIRIAKKEIAKLMTEKQTKAIKKEIEFFTNKIRKLEIAKEIQTNK